MERNWKDSREVPGTSRISYSQQQRKHSQKESPPPVTLKGQIPHLK